MGIELKSLAPDDREQFILDNQEAFRYGALEEFGLRDDHFEEDGEIISRKTIEQSIDGGEAYRIMQDPASRWSCHQGRWRSWGIGVVVCISSCS